MSTPDHNCPIAWAFAHSMADSAVDGTWCFDRFRNVIARLPETLTESDATRPELLLWDDGSVSVYYTPFDWVNPTGRIMLVGITPGRHQSYVALQEARRAIGEGLPSDEVLQRADRAGSFSGPMRTNLVTMLDGIRIGSGLGIGTTASLFGEHHDLATLTSAISYPVFVNGANYGGAVPPLTTTPILRALVLTMFGASVLMVPDALIVPLGKAASLATELLIGSGRLDARRCLLGFPHPSGATGWRLRQYQAARDAMSRTVRDWFQE
jgi:hypothetical protein